MNTTGDKIHYLITNNIMDIENNYNDITSLKFMVDLLKNILRT